MDKEMDDILQVEKQKNDEQRKKQKRLMRGVAICIFALIVGLGAISLLSLSKDLSKLNMMKFSIILVVFAGLSGLIEYIKKRKFGSSRSAATEIIHVLIFILMSLSMAYLIKY
ncbi:MAG: hypothetical protein CXR31_14085 [Geobacter sp.]|nr:MAG: hypothetical protein CXR31_14085 [Geobacter sp.]